MYNRRLYEIANQKLLLQNKQGPGSPNFNTFTYNYKYNSKSKSKLEGELEVGLCLDGVSLTVIEEIIESMKNQSFQFNPNIIRNSGFQNQNQNQNQKHKKGKFLNILKIEHPETQQGVACARGGLPTVPPVRDGEDGGTSPVREGQQEVVKGVYNNNTKKNTNNNNNNNNNNNTKKNNKTNRTATSTLIRTGTGTSPYAPPRDQIVLEVMRMILELIFEPTFSQSSHGFRTGKSCKTALKQIYTSFGEAT
jgi:hypothetical protein